MNLSMKLNNANDDTASGCNNSPINSDFDESELSVEDEWQKGIPENSSKESVQI